MLARKPANNLEGNGASLLLKNSTAETVKPNRALKKVSAKYQSDKFSMVYTEINLGQKIC